MSYRLSHAVIMILAVAAFVAPSGAAHRHHHDVMRTPPAKVSAPRPHQFYPEDVENGVHGNLPFNNQMRKFSDPLSANGGGR